MKKFFWGLIAITSCFTSLKATTVIVPSGTTQTSPITLLNSGDSVIVEENGVLETNDTAITMNNSSQTALNQGTIRTINDHHRGISNIGANGVITNWGQISTTGQFAHGIISTGNDAVMTNSGWISTTGQFTYGILNTGDDAVMTNSGGISTTGFQAGGISNSGDDAVMTNSGQISTISQFSDGIVNTGRNAFITNSGWISIGGNNSNGIVNTRDNSVITNSGLILNSGDSGNGILNLNGSNVAITNSGLISTTGNGVWGIISNGANAVITNSGQISTTGLEAHGIVSTGGAANVSIINSGLVSTTGVDAFGIYARGNNCHVINSGTIYSAQFFALYFNGANNVLTLLRGSNLQGPVRVDSNFTLNVERGLNLALTLDSGAFDNVGISAPYVVKNNVIAVIDRTGLALQADVAADLSDTIFGALYHHRLSCCAPCRCGPWIQGIGSYRKRNHDSHTVKYKNWQGGFLIGYGFNCLDGSISLFGGASFAKAKTDKSTQEANINSYIGGLSYEKIYCNTQLNVGVAAGYIDWDNERTVMNNLATGGKQKAQADINGWLLSPEVSVLHRFDALCHPTLGLTVRYAGLFLGDYHEKGSLTNLKVRNRDIGLLTTRLEAAVPYGKTYKDCCWNAEPYIGVFSRYQTEGRRVEGQLLDQSIHFAQKGPDKITAGFVGIRGNRTFGCFDCLANIETSFDNKGSSRVLCEAGLSWSF